MTFFTSTSDINALKNQYRKLAFELHPDKGGKKEDFQAMSEEYQTLLKSVLSGKFDSEKVKEEIEIDEQMREVLNKVIHLQGVIIEVVGNWLWITGNTYPVKEDIKGAKFKFSKKKTAWYWNDGTFKKKSKKSYSLDQIKDTYGSKKVNNTAYEIS